MTTQPSFSHYPGLCHEVQGRLACLLLCLRIQLWLYQWIDPGSWRIRGPAIIDCCEHLLLRDGKPKHSVQCWEFLFNQAFKSISCMTCPSRSSSSGPGKTVCSPRWDSTYRSQERCIILHNSTHKDTKISELLWKLVHAIQQHCLSLCLSSDFIHEAHILIGLQCLGFA